MVPADAGVIAQVAGGALEGQPVTLEHDLAQRRDEVVRVQLQGPFCGRRHGRGGLHAPGWDPQWDLRERTHALEKAPTTQSPLRQRERGASGGPFWSASAPRGRCAGGDVLTAAQLGLLEAPQGLGVQGAGVGTERVLGQLQGAIAGPGQ